MVTDSVPDVQGNSTVYRLRSRASQEDTWLCIGLDPDLALMPRPIPRDAAGVVRFCREIVDATHDLCCAYKLNFAFFEALGAEGWSALARVRAMISADIPVIADAKRGDIGNTARAYARAVFEALDFDAVTLNPYLGLDALSPFFACPGKLSLVLCRTSNVGEESLQTRLVEGEPLYLHVARSALAVDAVGDVGLVIGAT